VPVGAYEITVESTGFAKYQQSGITLALNQSAVVDVTMKPGAVQEVVNVVENASMLNTSTPEVGHALRRETFVGVAARNYAQRLQHRALPLRV
jgi:hypothetical protein